MAMDAKLDTALERLRVCEELESRALQAVWAFGSRSRDEAAEDSDLDLGVLCDPPLGLEAARVSDRIACALGIDVDVVDLASASGTLAWEILTRGKWSSKPKSGPSRSSCAARVGQPKTTPAATA